MAPYSGYIPNFIDQMGRKVDKIDELKDQYSCTCMHIRGMQVSFRSARCIYPRRKLKLLGGLTPQSHLGNQHLKRGCAHGICRCVVVKGKIGWPQHCICFSLFLGWPTSLPTSANRAKATRIGWMIYPTSSKRHALRKTPKMLN